MSTSESPRSGWREFWDRDNSIYVSERHKTLHYRQIADDIAALVPSPAAHVLDHGCGEALAAERVAARCARLYLCDAAPSVVERIARRFADRPEIHALLPEGVAALEDGSLDLVVANSVLQYLAVDELRELLALWKRKLKPGGRLVLADVISPDVSPLWDVAALLRFAGRGGFLLPALAGLVRTALSDYSRLRGQLGLTMYREAEIVGLLQAAGFTGATRAAHNAGHNQRRMTITAAA